VINFVAPADGKVYLNPIAAAVAAGLPLIAVNSTNRVVSVTFTAPVHEIVPNYALLASGVDGQFGPLNAGTWTFQILTNSYTFTVTDAPTPPAPSMGIALAGDQVVVSWPTLASNYVLQSTTDLATGRWSNITNGITITGTNYVFTNSMSGQAGFFRIQEQ
jgi:hypothetical protein